MPGSATSRYTSFLGIVTLWAASRATMALVLWLSPSRSVPLGETPAGLRDAMMQWDVNWLLGIAVHGYRQPHEAAFFPGFPLAVRALGELSGLDLVWAAVVLNLTLSLISALLLFGFVRTARSRQEAMLAVGILLLHPLSFYLFVPYSEALFLILVLGVFLAAARNRWAWAALCGAGAALTRNTGVLICLPLLYYAVFRQQDTSPGDRAGVAARGVRLAASLAPAVALAAYAAYTAYRFGSPMQFISAQVFWSDHIRPAIPFAALLHELGRWRAWVDHHLPLTLVGLWLGWRVLKHHERGLGLFCAPPLLLSVSLSKLAITPRLHLVLFPLWIEGARLLARSPRWLRITLAAGGAFCQCWLVLKFSRGEWVD